MNAQEDIVFRYTEAITKSTATMARDLGAIEMALRLAVQDAAKLAQPVAESWRDYEGELLTIHQWIETNAPWASKPDTTVADDAVALMSKQYADIETLQNAFNVEAAMLRSSITEQDIQIQNLRHEVDRLLALHQEPTKEAVLSILNGSGKTAPAAIVAKRKPGPKSKETAVKTDEPFRN